MLNHQIINIFDKHRKHTGYENLIGELSEITEFSLRHISKRRLLVFSFF